MSLSTVFIEESRLHGTYSKTEIHDLIQSSSLESIKLFIQNNLRFLSRNQNESFSRTSSTRQEAESTAMSIVDNALRRKWNEYQPWFEQWIEHQADQYSESYAMDLLNKAAHGPEDFKV